MLVCVIWSSVWCRCFIQCSFSSSSFSLILCLHCSKNGWECCDIKLSAYIQERVHSAAQGTNPALCFKLRHCYTQSAQRHTHRQRRCIIIGRSNWSESHLWEKQLVLNQVFYFSDDSIKALLLRVQLALALSSGRAREGDLGNRSPGSLKRFIDRTSLLCVLFIKDQMWIYDRGCDVSAAKSHDVYEFSLSFIGCSVPRPGGWSVAPSRAQPFL